MTATITFFGIQKQAELERVENQLEVLQQTIKRIETEMRDLQQRRVRSFSVTGETEDRAAMKVELERIGAPLAGLKDEVALLKEKEASLEMLKKLAEFADVANQFITIGETVAPEVPMLLGRALKILLRTVTGVNKEIGDELDAVAEMTARNHMRKFRALTQVGFADDAAMEILLAGIKPTTWTDNISGLNEAASKSPVKLSGLSR